MLRWVAAVIGVLAAVVVACAGLVIATALRSDHPVGFQIVTVDDPKGAPLEVGIWYPTTSTPWPTLTGLLVQFVARDAPVDGSRQPLIVISHGIAGALTSHADTALALADAGFIVAAPLHTGDNYRDQSAVGTTNWFTDRARHVHLTINYLLEAWCDRGRIDDTKIGIFGFSAGGTTALIAIGGMPDLDRIKNHCAKSSEFACRVWKSKKATAPDRDAFIHDPRIKAAVVIAPGAGFAFADYGLTNVRVPVQLWGAEKDESVPTPSNAEVVRRELGSRAEWHLVKNAAHFSFMVPCGSADLVAPKLICSDPTGFDRKTFHREFNRAVVAFFRKTLAKAPPMACVTDQVCAPNAELGHFTVFAPERVTVLTPTTDFDAFGQPVPRQKRHEKPVFIIVQDSYGELSRRSMEAACTKSWCIYYHKYCPEPTNCWYLLSHPVHNDDMRDEQKIMESELVRVETKTEPEFREAEGYVMLRASSWTSSTDEFIPLRRLNHRFDTPVVIGCESQKQVRGCLPPRTNDRAGSSP